MSGFSYLISFSPSFSIFHFLCSLLETYLYSSFHLPLSWALMQAGQKTQMFSVLCLWALLLCLCWDPAISTKLVLLVSRGGWEKKKTEIRPQIRSTLLTNVSRFTCQLHRHVICNRFIKFSLVFSLYLLSFILLLSFPSFYVCFCLVSLSHSLAYFTFSLFSHPLSVLHIQLISPNSLNVSCIGKICQFSVCSIRISVSGVDIGLGWTSIISRLQWL